MSFHHFCAQLAIIFVRFQYFMSGHPPNLSVLNLFPEITQEDPIRTWCGNTVVAENVGYACCGKILCIVHSKSKNSNNHKDIMFEVQLDGQTSWILTDRSAGGRNSTSSSSPSPSPSHSHTDLGTSSSSNAAYNHIIVPAFGKHDTILLWINDDPVTACSLKICLNVSVSLADLAGLLQLVTAQAKNYNPFAKQCYWYACVVYEFIKRKYSSEETRGDAYDRRGKHAKLLPVPFKVLENKLKLIQYTWLTRIEEIARVETISQVISHLGLFIDPH
jgi:hypothetical protein